MRIYLDNAATSWPKPEAVYDAMDRYAREVGAAAGRGAYREAQQAHQVVDAARQACARLLGAGDPRRIVWTCNGTDALNLALHGLLQPGDRVVATVVEHNSVLRPLAWAARTLGVEVVFAPCDADGYVDPEAIAQLLRRPTRLVALSHASNVTGAIQPVSDVAQLAHDAGALLLVDAAQTVGHVPLAIDDLGADLLAASCHKGLLGPLGAGLLYVGPDAERALRPVRQGGSGSESLRELPPEALPERFEAGNLNVPALAGVAAAAQFLLEHDVAELERRERPLSERLVAELDALPGVRVRGPRLGMPRAAVVSFGVEGYDPQEVAAILDASFDVQSRAGLHCAPRMHGALGTLDQGGLVRFSPGWRTTPQDIDAAIAAVAALCDGSSLV